MRWAKEGDAEVAREAVEVRKKAGIGARRPEKNAH
jgi:hypothetical protein